LYRVGIHYLKVLFISRQSGREFRRRARVFFMMESSWDIKGFASINKSGRQAYNIRKKSSYWTYG